MGRTSIYRLPVDADAEGRPLRASRGARAARPRYRSVLRRSMSLFGPNQVDSIRHIVFYENFPGIGLPQNRVDVPPSFPTTACIAAEIDDNLRSNSSSAN